MGAAAIPDRWVMCDRCGAPLGDRASATTVRCEACAIDVPLPPRDDAPIGSGEVLDEQGRLARLRGQDGQPLSPPPGLESLIRGGDLPPHKEREAIEIYLQDRRRLRESPDPAAQERLVFLTLILSNHLEDPVRRRALFETTLDAVGLRRHRQTIRGYLAREAARTGDVTAAEAWLAPCDARSDDLDMDSTWRFTRATIDLVRQDWRAVLAVLGSAPSDVPIEDSVDAVACVFRAHAHEQLGDVERAAAQLADGMAAGHRRPIESIVARYPQWALCARSLPMARDRYSSTAARSARQQSGGSIGPVLMGVGGLTGLMSLGMIVGGAVLAFQGDDEGFGLIVGGVISAVVAGPVVGLMGYRHWVTGQRQAAIRVHGLAATGTVISAQPTGTEINDVPLMEITLRVNLEGRPPWEATTRLLVPPQDNGILEAGRELFVRVDPDDPSQIVLDTG